MISLLKKLWKKMVSELNLYNKSEDSSPCKIIMTSPWKLEIYSWDSEDDLDSKYKLFFVREHPVDPKCFDETSVPENLLEFFKKDCPEKRFRYNVVNSIAKGKTPEEAIEKMRQKLRLLENGFILMEIGFYEDDIFEISETPFILEPGSKYVTKRKPYTVKAIGAYEEFIYDQYSKIIIKEGITKIGKGAFERCSHLKEIILPEGITEICENAFKGCHNLQNIVLPASVKKIGDGAFSDCWKLNNFIIPEGLEEIGEIAFEDCKKLTCLVLPKNLQKIGSGAFNRCKNLSYVVIPDELEDKINSSIFRVCNALPVFLCCGKTLIKCREDISGEIRIPDGITKIGNYAFYSCDKLTGVVIPDGVTDIGFRAFCCCGKLVSVKIPESVKRIGREAFYYCGNLKDVNLPENVELADDEIFYQCYQLPMICLGTKLLVWRQAQGNITIPEGITEIADSAFQDCRELTEVIIPDSVTKIGKSAFFGCVKLAKITIPSSVKKIGIRAFGCCDLLGNIIIGDKLVKWKNSPEDVIIPDGITEIGESAFEKCDLRSVTIPDSVTEIGKCAFLGCDNLVNIVVPSGVKEIGPLTFAFCDKLENVTVSDSVKTISYRAFFRSLCEKDMKQKYGHLFEGGEDD